MDKNIIKIERILHINKALHIVGLHDSKDKLINYLSGGEKRKLQLATELLTNPLFLFCDELTTGLDSFSAISVIKILKQLTSNSYILFNSNNDLTKSEIQSEIDIDQNIQKAIICSIHQPSSEIFHCFTHFILMNNGRILFQGNNNDAQIFFSQ